MNVGIVILKLTKGYTLTATRARECSAKHWTKKNLLRNIKADSEQNNFQQICKAANLSCSGL
jgi:hypothetical protein